MKTLAARRLPLLAAVSGLVYGLAYPPFSLRLLAWVALVPLYLALVSATPRLGALLGFIWGAAATSSTSWFIPAMFSMFFQTSFARSMLAFLVLATVIGLLCAPGAALVSWLARREAAGPFTFAAMFGVTEWVRAVLSLRYYDLGTSQAGTPFAQVADIFGVLGVSMLVALGNGVIGAWMVRSARPTSTVPAVAIIATAFVYGLVRPACSFGGGTPTRVAVIQGGAWYGQGHDLPRSALLGRYAALTRAAYAKGASLVVLPEHAIDFLPTAPAEQDQDVVRQLSTGHDAIVGGPYQRDGSHLYNSVYLFRDGKIAGRYDKMRLLPFAEDELGRLPPFGRVLFFRRGKLAVPLQSVAGAVGVMICSEINVAAHGRALAAGGAEILASPTNDFWFPTPAQSRAQLNVASMRAIETRRYLIRSAATGYSAVIDPQGRAIAIGPWGGTAILLAEVKRSNARTLYQLWGDALVIAAALYLGLSSLRVTRTSPTAPHRSGP